MIEKNYDLTFDVASSGLPYMVVPKVFSDNRGSFSEVLVGEDLSGTKQVNRSTSCQWTVRGFHALRAPHCQAKLVEALTIPIYDIIVDARPDSKTFGLGEAYLLDPEVLNKLYVPHGFLHAFAVPECKDKPSDDAVFMYYCDDTYSKEDEVGVNPMSILPKLAELWSKTAKNENHILWSLVQMLNSQEKLVLSDKDTNAQEYFKFMENAMSEYNETGKLWYK